MYWRNFHDLMNERIIGQASRASKAETISELEVQPKEKFLEA